jgi:hypothetical protein
MDDPKYPRVLKTFAARSTIYWRVRSPLVTMIPDLKNRLIGLIVTSN